jgi:Winged helix DNA-binding domain
MLGSYVNTLEPTPDVPESEDAWTGYALTHQSTVLVISDSAACTATAAQSAGAGVVKALTFAEVSTDTIQAALADLIIVECNDALPQLPDALFDHLTGHTGVALIASAPLEQLDLFSQFVGEPRTTMLCQPDVADLVIAVRLALADPKGGVQDRSTEVEAERLRRLADEVARIARSLSGLAAAAPPPAYFQPGVSDMRNSFKAELPSEAFETGALDATEVRAIIRNRRLRDRFFAQDLFADPAWDMLLDLTAARLEQVQVAVSSLCIAAAVPPTTALRWIKTMTDVGLFERVADPEDGRRIFIRLSEMAADAMARYLSAAKRLGAPTI